MGRYLDKIWSPPTPQNHHRKAEQEKSLILANSDQLGATWTHHMAIVLLITPHGREWAGAVAQKGLTCLANSWDIWVGEEAGRVDVVFTYLVYADSGRSGFQVSMCTLGKEPWLLPHRPSFSTHSQKVHKGGEMLIRVQSLQSLAWGKKCSSALLLLLCIICLILDGSRMCHIFAWWKCHEDWGMSSWWIS